MKMFLARATDIIDDSIISASGDLTFKDLEAIVKGSRNGSLPVAILRQDGSLHGVIDTLDLGEGSALKPLNELPAQTPMIVTPDTNAFELVAQMLSKSIEFAAVVSDGLFRGLVTRRSVTYAYGEMSAA